MIKSTMVKALLNEMVQLVLFLARYTLYFAGFFYAISGGIFGFIAGLGIIGLGYCIGVYAEEIQ